MADKRDYYEVLGVSKTAGLDEIKKSYRKLAKQYHPDSNPGDKEAEHKFKEASEAYAVLSDSDKRAKYDQFGHAAFDGAGGAGGFDFSGVDFSDIFGDFNFSDIFGGIFGGGRGASGYSGPRQGASLRAAVEIDFTEAVFGCEKELQLSLKDECPHCHGSGAKPGSEKITCTKCGGRGQVAYTQQSLFGMMRNVRSCPDCGGSGKIIKEKCPDCSGSGYVSSRKTISVSIPAGVDQENVVRIRGKGEPGINGGSRGDLLVSVYIRPHPIFQRRGNDIYSTVPMSYAQAVLGGEILVDTIDGQVLYNIKAGTATDTKVRLRGKGVPFLRNKTMRGDHYITLVVQVPVKVNAEAKELLLKVDKLTGNAIERAKEDIEAKNTEGKGKKEEHKNAKKGKKLKDKLSDLFNS